MLSHLTTHRSADLVNAVNLRQCSTALIDFNYRTDPLDVHATVDWDAHAHVR